MKRFTELVFFNVTGADCSLSGSEVKSTHWLSLSEWQPGAGTKQCVLCLREDLCNKEAFQVLKIVVHESSAWKEVELLQGAILKRSVETDSSAWLLCVGVL